MLDRWNQMMYCHILTSYREISSFPEVQLAGWQMIVPLSFEIPLAKTNAKLTFSERHITPRPCGSMTRHGAQDRPDKNFLWIAYSRITWSKRCNFSVAVCRHWDIRLREQCQWRSKEDFSDMEFRVHEKIHTLKCKSYPPVCYWKMMSWDKVRDFFFRQIMWRIFPDFWQMGLFILTGIYCIADLLYCWLPINFAQVFHLEHLLPTGLPPWQRSPKTI